MGILARRVGWIMRIRRMCCRFISSQDDNRLSAIEDIHSTILCNAEQFVSAEKLKKQQNSNDSLIGWLPIYKLQSPYKPRTAPPPQPHISPHPPGILSESPNTAYRQTTRPDMSRQPHSGRTACWCGCSPRRPPPRAGFWRPHSWRSAGSLCSKRWCCGWMTRAGRRGRGLCVVVSTLL